MMQTPKKSRAWQFIAVSVTSLVLFTIVAWALISSGGPRSVRELPPGVIAAFGTATVALGAAICANISAYLNPKSTFTTRILSPFLLLLVALVIIPFFASLGVTLTT